MSEHLYIVKAQQKHKSTSYHRKRWKHGFICTWVTVFSLYNSNMCSLCIVKLLNENCSVIVNLKQPNIPQLCVFDPLPVCICVISEHSCLVKWSASGDWRVQVHDVILQDATILNMYILACLSVCIFLNLSYCFGFQKKRRNREEYSAFDVRLNHFPPYCFSHNKLGEEQDFTQISGSTMKWQLMAEVLK